MNTDDSNYFQAFARIFQGWNASNLEDALNEDRGLATQFRDACETVITSRAEEEGGLDAWTLQRNTWKLAIELFPQRLAPPPEDILSPAEMLASNPYTPPSAIVNSLASTPPLSELNLVRAWLSDVYDGSWPLEQRKSYWPSTKRREAQKLRSGGVKGPGLDPDAVARGLVLEADDAAYDRALVRTLFTHVRGGTLPDALAICSSSSQPWRAASLRGFIPYTAPPFSDVSSPEVNARYPPAEGNRHRALWRRTCMRLAGTITLDPYERALYGCLVGDLKSVRPVCSTWEDHLWARVNARFEKAVEKGLRESGGWWATKGGLGKDGSTTDNMEEDDEDLNVMFDRVANEEEMNIPAKNPYRVAQRHIILNTLPVLLNEFAGQLPRIREDLQSNFFDQLVCFFAHFALFLSLVGAADAAIGEAEVAILEAYCRVLQERDEGKLVAVYAGAMGRIDSEAGEESYALYLISLNNADFTQRKEALFQTLQHDLDLANVAQRVVYLIFTEYLSHEGTLEGPDPPIADLTDDVQPNDGTLIYSVDWLTFDESTIAVALTRANDLFRYFLCCGRLEAAKLLLQRLPPDLVQRGGQTMAVESQQPEEFALHMKFMGCMESITLCWKLTVPEPNESRAAAEERGKKYLAAVKAARESTLDLLKRDWLHIPAAGAFSDQRPEQLARIRHIYVPELIIRLHRVLYAARYVMPGALTMALDLATVVADERYKLYTEFITEEGNKLPSYLAEVRQAGLAALESGSVDPFARIV